MFHLIKSAYAQEPIPLGEEGFTGITDFVPVGEGREGISLLEEIFTRTLGTMTVIAGIIFLIMFIIGGLNWITAGGDKGKVDASKARMTSSAIGMIIIVAAYAISWIVGEVLGFKILDPVESLCTISGAC